MDLNFFYIAYILIKISFNNENINEMKMHNIFNTFMYSYNISK